MLKHFSISEALQVLQQKIKLSYYSKYKAFYSSLLDGVITDPALMLIPFDDHMCHRAHAVYDQLQIIDGKIFDLQHHLKCMQTAAEVAKIKLPFEIELIDISGERNALLKY